MQKMYYRFCLSLLASTLLCYSCTSSTPDPFWECQHVSNDSRLIYSNPDNHLKLQFLKVNGEIASLIYIDQHRFTPSELNPNLTELILTIDGVETKEYVPIRLGSMRIKLSSELSLKLINGLKNQKEVAIMTSGFKEQFPTQTFEKEYGQFSKGGSWLLQSIKGPLE